MSTYLNTSPSLFFKFIEFKRKGKRIASPLRQSGFYLLALQQLEPPPSVQTPSKRFIFACHTKAVDPRPEKSPVSDRFLRTTPIPEGGSYESDLYRYDSWRWVYPLETLTNETVSGIDGRRAPHATPAVQRLIISHIRSSISSPSSGSRLRFNLYYSFLPAKKVIYLTNGTNGAEKGGLILTRFLTLFVIYKVWQKRSFFCISP